MGLAYSTVLQRIRLYRIVITGLNSAGKATLLKKLKIGDTTPVCISPEFLRGGPC